MSGKKKSAKKEIDESKLEKKPRGKKSRDEEDEIDETGGGDDLDEFKFNGDDDIPADDDGGIEEIDEDKEEEEFLNHIKEYDKQHKNVRVVKVFEKIGKPKVKKLAEIKDNELAGKYKDLICLLDNHNIIVHFQNDYPLKERYRFITEEVFKQDVEDFKKSNIHINFIYEDFHPEMIEDDEEDELY